MLSLQDVLLKRARIGCKTDVVESYSMGLDVIEGEGRGAAEDKERTIIVKRMDITFNEKECQLLNFTDITSYKRLKKQEEINRLLKTLNASVHHEMLAPLKANMEISMRLYKQLKNKIEKQMAQTINISSNLLMLHAQDLLDQRIIENDSFVP